MSAGAPPLPAHAVKEPPLVAEELLVNGALGETGIARVAEAVGRAVDAAVRMGVDQLYPFVTAAIRDAANRDEVIDRIQAVSGIRPQFLSGQEEARLTYLAARRWYGWSAGRLLLVDIGGGSMELVLGRDVEPEPALST
ncbi:Ppx/GppA phosphatase family protein [Amycolatopsis sp. NPDC004368]